MSEVTNTSGGAVDTNQSTTVTPAGGGAADTRTAVAGGTTDTKPSIFDLADDTMVRIGGKEVKFGDYSKRQQADYTRKTQAAEQLRQQVLKQQQEIASERRRLESIAASLVGRQGGQGGQVDPFMAELGAAEFIDGKTAVKMLQSIHQGIAAPVAKAIQERDQVITKLYQEVVKLSNAVRDMGGRFGEQDLDGKIRNWLKEGGYPEEAADLAKELYVAYEGDDLDSEFPNIFRNRWEQLEAIQEKRRQAKIDAARKVPMLPGKGGNGAASKPIGLKGNESAKQITDLLWDSMQADERT